MTIIIFTILAIIISQLHCCTVHSISTQHPLQIMPPCTVRLAQNAGRRRQDNGATATVVSQKTKAFDNTNGLIASNEDNPMEVEENWPPLPLAVVSLPRRPILPLSLPATLVKKWDRSLERKAPHWIRTIIPRRTCRSKII